MLAELLEKLFKPHECLRFLRKYFCDELISNIPVDEPVPARFFDEVAMALHRRGLPTVSLRDALIAERPNQKEAIHAILGPGQEYDHVFELTLSGELRNMTAEKIIQILETLRVLLQDDSVVVLTLRSGSIKIFLSVSRETNEKLKILEESGELSAVIQQAGEVLEPHKDRHEARTVRVELESDMTALERHQMEKRKRMLGIDTSQPDKKSRAGGGGDAA